MATSRRDIEHADECQHHAGGRGEIAVGKRREAHSHSPKNSTAKSLAEQDTARRYRDAFEDVASMSTLSANREQKTPTPRDSARIALNIPAPDRP